MDIKLRDMGEDLILYEALRAVPDYREKIRETGKFNLEDCVRDAMKRIEYLFRADRGLRTGDPLGAQNRRQLEVLLAYFRPKVIDAIRPVQQRYMQNRMVAEINATAAKGLLLAVFAERGLPAEVEGQRHRAKVEVRLAPSLRVKFYVRYRDLNEKEGVAEDVVQAVLDLKDAVTRLGSGVMLNRK